MKTDERWLPWDPVPREANRYMELGVAHFEQLSILEGTPICAIIVSSIVHGSSSAKTDYAWRVRFEHAPGFRYRPIEQPVGLAQLTHPGGAGRIEVAAWELAPSHWLPEAIGALYARPHAVHHFVIASSYGVYDIAAETWVTEELGEWSYVSRAFAMSAARAASAEGGEAVT